MNHAKLTVVYPEQIGTIAPELYGHFVEHIGGVVYDGIWVGKDSDIPNENGFRKDLLDLLRAVKPAVIRWPGGCFAETYNWRDGIGKNRPVRPAWWTTADHKYETNAMGTHEFVELCRLVGAKPYIALNVTSMTPLDARDYMDYCLSPQGTTTRALEREKNGSAQPFDIPYWGIGNENWGGGGNMTAEEYANTYRRYATVLKNAFPSAKLIAGGGTYWTYDWVRTFMNHITQTVASSVPINGLSFHYYCSGGDAVAYNENDWDTLIANALKTEEYLIRHWASVVSHGKQEKIKLYVDEWGCMHPENGSGPHGKQNPYEQAVTVRDAVVTAIHLNIFNNHCDFVEMANVAQVCNCLHSLFFTEGKQLVKTPVYHVFDMMKAHQGGTCVKTLSIGDANLSVSSSVMDGKLTMTMANLSCTEDAEVSLELLGAQIKNSVATARLLYAQDFHAQNTFESPFAVTPCDVTLDLTKPVLLPQTAIMTMQFDVQ